MAALFVFDLGRFFSLVYVKGAQGHFAQLYAEQPLLVLGGFFALYVVATALSLPGATILTLVVVPVLYSYLVRDRRKPVAASAGPAPALMPADKDG